jgi:hypothetical protein
MYFVCVKLGGVGFGGNGFVGGGPVVVGAMGSIIAGSIWVGVVGVKAIVSVGICVGYVGFGVKCSFGDGAVGLELLVFDPSMLDHLVPLVVERSWLEQWHRVP